MLRWCAHCQQFIGEMPPHADLSITHGLCRKCSGEQPDLLSDGEFAHAVVLRDIFQALFAAGRKSDFDAAGPLVDRAIVANCRPVDILVGMIAPMLYEIGRAWERGTLTVAGEHEFTAFAERVVDLVEARMNRASSQRARFAGEGRYFLMNAPGNTHVVGIRILALWLQNQGWQTRHVDELTVLDALSEPSLAGEPKTLLVSIALLEQCEAVRALVERVQALPAPNRPKIVLGGYAVKTRLVPRIPGVVLARDISALGLD
ncbi:cobalamin B12-binding domain-containing protein [Bradyrhizobium sp. CCGE-LA001]|uniref:cobalamin B12-binding domain-containing protein n=1 Tax=Bradyrhizobium sp. CCGE-LA001 TaxID=1223566 RepID=UPI001313E9C1|nr:B12-binding domain-containing protein [Bradyrhizobium sp. CCGE-LA001]